MSKHKPKKLEPATRIHRVLQLIRPYTGMVILTLTLALITVVTTLLAPVLAGRAVDMIVGPGRGRLSVGLGRIALAHGGHDRLHGAVPMADECCEQPHHLSGRAGYAGASAFEQLEILPLKYMDAHRPGDAISRITTDVEQFSDGLLMGFTQLFTGVLTILGTLGVMLYIDWRIALVVVALTPLSIFVARVHCDPYLFYVQGAERDPRRDDQPGGGAGWQRASGSCLRLRERVPRSALTRINLDLQKLRRAGRRSSPPPRTPAPALSMRWSTPRSACWAHSWPLRGGITVGRAVASF